MIDTTDIKALSYARLIEVRNILSGFEDGYDTVADRENYEAMRDAQASIDELISLRDQLEAERQRANESGERFYKAVKYGANIEAELAALKGEQVPVAYLIHEKGGNTQLRFHGLDAIRKCDIEEHELWQEPLFTTPQKPVVWLGDIAIHDDLHEVGSLVSYDDVVAAIEAAGGIVKDGE